MPVARAPSSPALSDLLQKPACTRAHTANTHKHAHTRRHTHTYTHTQFVHEFMSTRTNAQDEAAVSICVCTFADKVNETFVLVGTVLVSACASSTCLKKPYLLLCSFLY